MAERDIRVKFTGDSDDLERAARDAGDAVDKSGKSMAGGFTSMLGPATIAAGAIAGVGAVVFDLTKAALDEQAAQETLAGNLRNFAGASDEAIAGAEGYITALSKSAAVAEDDLRPALGNLTAATGDLAEAQDLLTLAADISAGSGRDLESVVSALNGARRGEMDSIEELGIVTEDATGKTLSFGEIAKQAGEKYGGMAETVAGTGQGKLKNAQIQFDELQKEIGAKLLPILTTLAEVFVNDVLPAIQSAISWIEQHGPGLWQNFVDGARMISDVVTPILEAIGSFWAEWGDEIVNATATVFGAIFGFVQWYMTTVAQVITQVIGYIQTAWDNWGEQIVSTVTTVFGVVVDFIGTIVGNVQRIWAAFTAVLRGDWATVWDNIKGIVAAGFAFLRDDIFGRIGPMVSGALAGLANLITAPFRAAFNAIADLWNQTVGKLSFTLPDWIPGLGGAGFDVPDIPTMGAFGAQAMAMPVIVMPPGSDGYDVARQLRQYDRAVGAAGSVAVAVR